VEVISTISNSISKVIGKDIPIVSIMTATVSRLQVISQLISYTVTTTVNMRRSIAITKSKLISVVILFSKVFNSAVSELSTQTNRNVATIGLTVRNSISNALNLSHRAIIFKDREDDNS
jgi:hypothetical protein